jgi:hypothetical protein
LKTCCAAKYDSNKRLSVRGTQHPFSLQHRSRIHPKEKLLGIRTDRPTENVPKLADLFCMTRGGRVSNFIFVRIENQSVLFKE